MRRPDDDCRLEAAARAELSYKEVGATRHDHLSDGVAQMHRRYRLGEGSACFQAASHHLNTWDMHRDAGFRLIVESPAADVATVVVLQAACGPFKISAPAKVVYAVSEPDRSGFAYGTLPGHPLAGEELFLVVRQPDGAVYLELTAFARPATALGRLLSPFQSLVQMNIARRYATSLTSTGAGRRT